MILMEMEKEMLVMSVLSIRIPEPHFLIVDVPQELEIATESSSLIVKQTSTATKTTAEDVEFFALVESIV